MKTEKVMDKLRDEMAAKHGDPGIQIIGEAMTRMLRLSPDTAEAVGAEGKTLAGAFAAVRSWAEKHKTGNSCFVPPAQAAAGGPPPEPGPGYTEVTDDELPFH